MKKKSLLTIITIFTLILSMSLSACAKKPDTLEGFVKTNPDVQEQINSAAVDENMFVEIKGNDISFTYDLSNAAGASADSLKDATVQEGLQKLIEDSADRFKTICKEIESTSGLSGINLTISFVYEGETIATKTFSADE